jgi:hypothetical protein
MKRAGAVIFFIGVVIALFAGFNYVTMEKVVDMGSMEISVEKNNRLEFSPFVGLGIIVLGGALYLFGHYSKRS